MQSKADQLLFAKYFSEWDDDIARQSIVTDTYQKQSCQGANYPNPTDKTCKRFWKKVDKFGPVPPGFDTPCWIWTAAVDHSGYGRFRHNGNMRHAHRVSYEIANGPISEYIHVLHHCDNPGCVNHDHLYLGTPLENHRDMVERGRRVTSKGTKRLTPAQVQSLRKLARQGVSHAELSEKFNRHVIQISKIVNQHNYRNIT